ncbi:MAG: host-nuclease inhibitor Gam family protein [Acidimicrobiales bacterium]
MDDELRRDLTEHMTGWAGGDDEPPEDGWEHDRPPDLTTANIVLRRMARARTELERIEQVRADERERIDGWAADRSRGPERLLEYSARQLEGFARAAHAADPRVQSWNLPSGRFGLRRGIPRTVIDDEAALCDWLTAQGHSEALKVEARRGAVAKLGKPVEMSGDEAEGADADVVTSHLVDEYGEVIPGIHIEVSRDLTFQPPKPTKEPT